MTDQWLRIGYCGRCVQAVNSFRRTSTDVYLSQVVEIMRKLDTDRDGVLTREEFVRGCANDPVVANMLIGSVVRGH